MVSVGEAPSRGAAQWGQKRAGSRTSAWHDGQRILRGIPLFAVEVGIIRTGRMVSGSCPEVAAPPHVAKNLATGAESVTCTGHSVRSAMAGASCGVFSI